MNSPAHNTSPQSTKDQYQFLLAKVKLIDLSQKKSRKNGKLSRLQKSAGSG